MTRHPRNSNRSRSNSNPSKPSTKTDSGWDPVAHWYAQWVGVQGSDYHRELVIPSVLELLSPQPHETIVDIGCGTGVLCQALPSNLRYIGVDLSPRLLSTARRLYGDRRSFLHGDATQLTKAKGLRESMADAVVFVLSIQDMNPLDDVLRGVSWLLKQGGRVVVMMFHPCFRVPRQSGWGWDDGRSLQYRRVDSYLTHREVPVRPIAHGRPGSIKAYHRPLEAYINGLSDQGLQLTRMLEVPAFPGVNRKGPRSRAENRANTEIPLLLGLKAKKVT